jgi:hypothetical protein
MIDKSGPGEGQFREWSLLTDAVSAAVTYRAVFDRGGKQDTFDFDLHATARAAVDLFVSTHANTSDAKIEAVAKVDGKDFSTFVTDVYHDRAVGPGLTHVDLVAQTIDGKTPEFLVTTYRRHPGAPELGSWEIKRYADGRSAIIDEALQSMRDDQARQIRSVTLTKLPRDHSYLGWGTKSQDQWNTDFLVAQDGTYVTHSQREPSGTPEQTLCNIDLTTSVRTPITPQAPSHQAALA